MQKKEEPPWQEALLFFCLAALEVPQHGVAALGHLQGRYLRNLSVTLLKSRLAISISLRVPVKEPETSPLSL